MNIYKSLLISITLSLIAGLYVGYKLAINKHNKLLIDIQNQHLEIYEKEQAKTNEYKQISQSYYEAYLAASDYITNNEPARVYIKASCPSVPTNTSGSVGDAAEYTKAELHPATTKRITAVTNQAVADVLKCQAQLTSLQQKITLFNKGK